MPANVARIVTPPQPDEARAAPEQRLALERRISLLAHRVSASFTQIANKLLSRQGINMYESRILLFLLEHGEMRVGELVDAMALPQSTISHQLKQLQARRLIRRRRSRRDNRLVSVMMTPAGQEIAQACERYSVHVQRGLLEHFGAAQLDKLTASFDALFEFLGTTQFSPDEIDGMPPPEPAAAEPALPRKRRAPRVEPI